VKVTPSSGLSQDEILRMKEEAKMFSQKDQERKEKRLALNRLDGLTKNVQRSFAEYGYLLNPEKSNQVKNVLAEAMKFLSQGDMPVNLIDEAYRNLESTAMEITNAMLATPGMATKVEGDSQKQMEQLLREAMTPKNEDE
jgi:molecular chaperone DnaK